MHGNSTKVYSSQEEIHPQLTELLTKHFRSPYLRPIAEHTITEYELIQQRILDASKNNIPLVLDSCCGTGESSLRLAQQHPDSLVVGFDRSLHRLSKNIHHHTDRVLLARANAEDMWRLLARDGIRIWRHYLLYPNPSPKPHHIMRRWHGHPIFPELLSISNAIELRTNWHIYAEEFAVALRFAQRPAECAMYSPQTPLSPFENKYNASEHTLWRVVSP